MGPFVPEGHSNKVVKSKSDMTAMCQFAIAQKNYYWDLPDNYDEVASFNCCVKFQGRKVRECRETIARMKSLGARYDYCAALHQYGQQ
jgi:hypothetical protein